ncbi:chromatin assembly complex, subunit 3 [Scheffersomyces coipomensis]|uniref:chromatin assembly complex, subunit 3 n=1 Tax=Scheffersomyces coipomensis TaxID=1788519 RepID=UPI00315CB47B
MTDVETTAREPSFEKEESEEIQEESAISEKAQKEYRIWKKNSPFLYDYISTNSLLWPSLTIQFFPDRADPAVQSEGVSDVYYQRLLHGTFTLGQSVDSISVLQVPQFQNLNKNLKISQLDYSQDKEEFELKSSSHKIKVLQKINHFGDINNLKYMPQNPNIIAASNNYGNISIYERTKHKSFKNSIIDDTELNKVQIHLSNNADENSNVDIFAMDWNKQREGSIISANVKGQINLYDIKQNYASDKDDVFPHWSFKSEGEDVGINDIEWFPNHDSMFSTVDESGFIKIFDTRLPASNSLTLSHRQSSVGVNSISINSGSSMCIATGDSRGHIQVWDIRDFNKESASSLYSITNQHTDSITQLKWHPKYHNILGSASTDTSVRIMDVSNHEHNEGLVFLHAGHMLGVNDFDWSYHDDWLVASVADDNSLHIWKPTHSITSKYSLT